MRANWDAPASERLPHLPADRSLRAYGRELRACGATWPAIGAALGMTEHAARRGTLGIQCSPNKPRPSRAAPEPKPTITPRQWKRIAKAYGVTVTQLRQLRAAGITVGEARELAAARVDSEKQMSA